MNLTEIDVPKVTIGDKTTVTFDALSGKTFAGKVISIDTVGTVTSGVTNYPAVIALDTANTQILPNMSATANIITATKDNVMLIPSSAVQTQNDVSAVRVMKNGKVSEVTVEIGLSSDTQTEIVSGITEGDTVVSSVTQSTGSSTSQTGQSPFGIFGGGQRGGNQIRIPRD